MTELAKRAELGTCVTKHRSLPKLHAFNAATCWMWKPAKDLGLEIERLQAGVRELTAQLEQTLVIARQALVYFNTESGRAAMKELEKIEARTKGEEVMRGVSNHISREGYEKKPKFRTRPSDLL